MVYSHHILFINCKEIFENFNVMLKKEHNKEQVKKQSQ